MSTGKLDQGLPQDQAFLSCLHSILNGRFVLFFTCNRMQSGMLSKSMLYANFRFCLGSSVAVDSLEIKYKKNRMSKMYQAASQWFPLGKREREGRPGIPLGFDQKSFPWVGYLLLQDMASLACSYMKYLPYILGSNKHNKT